MSVVINSDIPTGPIEIPIISSKEAMFEQNNTEVDILMANDEVCPPGTLEEVSLNLEELQSLAFSQALTERFYDATLMRAIECIFQGIEYVPPSDPDRPQSQNIRHWLQLKKTVGEPSAAGVAMLGSIRDFGDSFVVKVARSQPSEDPLLTEAKSLHEYFIGNQGTNRLRSLDPGYAYVFGMFGCSQPAIHNSEVVTFCNPEANPATYIVYERIVGISWKEFVRTCSFDDFMRCLLQLCNTLHLGNTVIGITHYDLHPGNIILRLLAEPRSIRFNMGRHTGFIANTVIPTIIDFGMSHIVVNNEHYGIYGLAKVGVYPNQIRPQMDLYKILMFSIAFMMKYNNPALQPVSQLMRYFRSDEITPEVIKTEHATRFAYNTELAKRSLVDFTDWIFRYLNPRYVITPEVQSPLLVCIGGGGAPGCQTTVNDALASLGLILNGNVTQPRDLKDLADQFLAAAEQPGGLEVMQEAFLKEQTVYLEWITDMFEDILQRQKHVNEILEDSRNQNRGNTSLTLTERLYRLAQIADDLSYTTNDISVLRVILTNTPDIGDFVPRLEQAAAIHAQQQMVMKPFFVIAKTEKNAIITASYRDNNIKARLPELLLTIDGLPV